MTENRLARGSRLGRYEIRQLIGQGGMGNVFRAWDTVLQRDVAIKTISSDVEAGASEDVRARFEREALAISRIDHPNVVRVLDFGFGEDNQPFMVMEHLRGHDLRSLLSRGLLPIPRAVDIMLGVCAGIAACHRRGIVHRDLKPGNIFLADTELGEMPKVLDFGVSKMTAGGEMTRHGVIVGTPRYMAPEQASGQPATAASDQYAIGVLLYLCLTGKVPYDGLEGLPLLQAIARGEFPSLRSIRHEIPEDLEVLVLRAMRADVEGRFSSVHELGRRLLPFATRRGREQWSEHFTAPAPDGLAVQTSVTPQSGQDAADRTLNTTTVDEIPPRTAVEARVEPRSVSEDAEATICDSDIRTQMLVVPQTRAQSARVAHASPRHRTRPWVAVSALAIAAAIVALLGVGAHALRPQKKDIVARPLAPEPRLPSGIADASPIATTDAAMPGAVSDTGVVPSMSVARAEDRPARVSEDQKPRRRHVRKPKESATPSIEYGPDGVPILQ